jgi:hypothetical protein
MATILLIIHFDDLITNDSMPRRFCIVDSKVLCQLLNIGQGLSVRI